MYIMPDCQDWTEVVIHNKNYNKTVSQQKQNAPGTKRFYELDGAGEIPPPKKITHEQRQALMEARNAKGLDMEGLAKLVPHLTKKTVQEYENGTATNFNQSLYNKMMRALGVKPVK